MRPVSTRSSHEATQAIELFKFRAIDFIRPRTLYLGNSRAEMGWDPEALGAMYSPGVNVSIPGRALGGISQLADYAWSRSQQRTLFIGVDFFDCLASGNSVEYIEPAPHPWAADARSLRGVADRTYLILSDLLSLDTTIDSIQTVIGQWRDDSPHLRRDGFQSARDYKHMVVTDGARKMFLQREQETVRRRLSGPKSIRHDDGKLDACFGDLERLLRNGVLRHQTMYVGTYPYHARLLEIIGQIGLWPAYEDWKREILRIVTAARAQGAQVSVRDFGAYHPYSVEPIPMAGRRQPMPRWYWESGHFKSELGARMLRIMAGLDPADGLFGVELRPETIDATLAAIRESRQAFAGEQAGGVAEIGEMIDRARSSKASP